MSAKPAWLVERPILKSNLDIPPDLNRASPGGDSSNHLYSEILTATHRSLVMLAQLANLFDHSFRICFSDVHME
jgi:hypothetical protein